MNIKAEFWAVFSRQMALAELLLTPDADRNQWGKQYAVLSGRGVIGFDRVRGKQRRNPRACDIFIRQAILALRRQHPEHAFSAHSRMLRLKITESKATVRKAWERRVRNTAPPSEVRHHNALFYEVRRRNAGIFAEIQKPYGYHPRQPRRRKN